MKLTKDGLTYDVTDNVQISAFLNSGWAEDTKPEQPKRVTQPKKQEADNVE